MGTFQYNEFPFPSASLQGRATITARLAAGQATRSSHLLSRLPGTVSHDKLKQLASQGGAAALFSGNAPQGGLAEHVGADQGALAQITQKLGAAADLKAAFARRHQELEDATLAGRDWLGIEHDTLPDRMAFIRAAAPRTLWMVPTASMARPATRERKPSQPTRAAQGLVGQKAAVSFGDLDAIGKALRAARKARREELEQKAESFQSPLFDL